jgi:hypothetical protein
MPEAFRYAGPPQCETAGGPHLCGPALMELPGIEPGCLTAETPSDLRVGSVSTRFVPARFLWKQTRLLTASRPAEGQQNDDPSAALLCI